MNRYDRALVRSPNLERPNPSLKTNIQKLLTPTLYIVEKIKDSSLSLVFRLERNPTPMIPSGPIKFKENIGQMLKLNTLAEKGKHHQYIPSVRP